MTDETWNGYKIVSSSMTIRLFGPINTSHLMMQHSIHLKTNHVILKPSQSVEPSLCSVFAQWWFDAKHLEEEKIIKLLFDWIYSINSCDTNMWLWMMMMMIMDWNMHWHMNWNMYFFDDNLLNWNMFDYFNWVWL